MPKIIALHSATGALAKYLTEQGYKAVDFSAAGQPGTRIDAILCTGYNPDIVATHFSVTERVDISLGNINCTFNYGHFPASINITGMDPQQVRDILNSRLEHHRHIFCQS